MQLLCFGFSPKSALLSEIQLNVHFHGIYENILNILYDLKCDLIVNPYVYYFFLNCACLLVNLSKHIV